MDVSAAIAAFISELEEGLGTVFLYRHFDRTIMLHSETANIAIAIYLAGNTGRIPLSNIRTFHIDQDQIIRDRSKLLSRLFSLLGKGQVVYARQTVVARIDKRIASAFLEEHHLQVTISGKYRYGLYHNGELMSVAIFSGGRRMLKKHEGYRSFELLRFCHKGGYRVVGGLSKLLKSFIADFHPNDIMTYVDRDWAQDSNLRTLGFEEQGHTAPHTFWVTAAGRQAIRDAAHQRQVQETFPSGYLLHNLGSTKLVLSISETQAINSSRDPEAKTK